MKTINSTSAAGVCTKQILAGAFMAMNTLSSLDVLAQKHQYHFHYHPVNPDTVLFNAHVAGEVILGSHLLFQERDRGAIVLGRVQPGNRLR